VYPLVCDASVQHGNNDKRSKPFGRLVLLS
jgi:hypothetical protein